MRTLNFQSTSWFTSVPMENLLIRVWLLVFLFCRINCTSLGDEERALSRRKRYIVFPEGASLTVEICFTVNILNMPTTIFTEVINFGINYDLPNKTGFGLIDPEQPKHVVQRRQRRDLYRKFELILNAIGFDGRSCVYRALCETSQNFSTKGQNLYEELLRLLFRFPLQKLYNFEPEDHRLYHWAHRMGHENNDCVQIFPNCGFSVIDTMLGYNARRTGIK